MVQTGEAVDVRAALLRLRCTSGLPVVFGGLLEDHGRLRIRQLTGTETDALRGLSVATGNGIGGKTLALTRPTAVADYPVSRTISHEYDAAVAEEGLRAVLAVPVVVRHRVRGVLYGALRERMPLGDRTIAAAMEAARGLERALAERDEVQRLLAVRPRTADPRRSPDGADPGPVAWEEVRAAHGDLRALAARVADPALREEILSACGRLATAAGGAPCEADGPAPGIRLAPRELDVLACVASGATNAGAAERLGLRPETVKGYLRSAMRKLGARTRLEAVVTARRAGLLP
ncbi:response regulator transcription factor [Streptomyces sp. NPDC001922]|uniref:helix-turn-helix transcriptional regulator n=1 Tax=Streptomyces sp. NPDC001922 TaxID=3364624 RepID=UPI00369197F6